MGDDGADALHRARGDRDGGGASSILHVDGRCGWRRREGSRWGARRVEDVRPSSGCERRPVPSDRVPALRGLRVRPSGPRGPQPYPWDARRARLLTPPAGPGSRRTSSTPPLLPP